MTKSDISVTNKTVNEIIEKGSDREVLDSLLEFLRTRVELTTGYVRDEVGLLTHSAIVVRCGSLEGQSAPQRLDQPLIALSDLERLEQDGAKQIIAEENGTIN